MRSMEMDEVAQQQGEEKKTQSIAISSCCQTDVALRMTLSR